jgi:hypothetical protein
MKNYRLVVLQAPVEGQEDEYNQWLQKTHLPEMLATDGFKVAQRFRLNKPLMKGQAYPYLTIYEIETDDIDKAFAEAVNHASPTSTAIAPGSYVCMYEECDPPVRHGETER